MVPGHATPGTSRLGGSTRKFLDESRRKRIPPLLWLGAAGAALFGAFLGWTFLADHRTPDEWWIQEVEPSRQRMREAESRRDWEDALAACDEAIRRAQEHESDYSSRIAELKAARRQLIECRRAEREADALAGGFRKRAEEVLALPPSDPMARYRRARELVLEGEELLQRIAGTGAKKKVGGALELLKAVAPPPPPRTWIEVKREVDAAVVRNEFSEALDRLAAFGGPSASAEDRRKAGELRLLVEARAGEYVRRRYPPDRTLEDLVRERGRDRLLEEMRDDLRRVRGSPAEKNLQERIAALTP